MKKQAQIALFLGIGLAILLFFASGLYCVLPEQAMYRQARAYLVKNFEIIHKEPASLYQMDFNPEYLLLAQDSENLYLGHMQGKLDNMKPFGHWKPAGDLTTHPRGEVLSFIRSPITIEHPTTDAQQAESGFYSMDMLPIFVMDEHRRGDTVKGTLDFTIEGGDGFYDHYTGLHVEMDACTALNAEGFGILYFNTFDIRLSDLTPEMGLDEEDPLWLGYSILSRVAERNKTIDLHLMLLQDGEAIHTETVRIGAE